MFEHADQGKLWLQYFLRGFFKTGYGVGRQKQTADSKNGID